MIYWYDPLATADPSFLTATRATVDGHKIYVTYGFDYGGCALSQPPEEVRACIERDLIEQITKACLERFGPGKLQRLSGKAREFHWDREGPTAKAPWERSRPDRS